MNMITNKPIRLPQTNGASAFVHWELDAEDVRIRNRLLQQHPVASMSAALTAIGIFCVLQHLVAGSALR
jgi:hypothetical protein